LLSRGSLKYTAWHMAAGTGHVEILQKVWDWAKELQLKPEELRNDVWLSKSRLDYMVWHLAAEKATLKFYRNCGIGLRDCS